MTPASSVDRAYRAATEAAAQTVEFLAAGWDASADVKVAVDRFAVVAAREIRVNARKVVDGG